MLDGERYYSAFPEENPEIRLGMRRLFDLLKKLGKEFRQHIGQSHVETTHLERDNKPRFQESYD